MKITTISAYMQKVPMGPAEILLSKIRSDIVKSILVKKMRKLITQIYLNLSSICQTNLRYVILVESSAFKLWLDVCQTSILALREKI